MPSWQLLATGQPLRGVCQESGVITRKTANTSCDNLGRGFRGPCISLLNGGSGTINGCPSGDKRERPPVYSFTNSTVALTVAGEPNTKTWQTKLNDMASQKYAASVPLNFRKIENANVWQPSITKPLGGMIKVHRISETFKINVQNLHWPKQSHYLPWHHLFIFPKLFRFTVQHETHHGSGLVRSAVSMIGNLLCTCLPECKNADYYNFSKP